MKLVASLFSLVVASSAFAAPSFECPSADPFMDKFTNLFMAAAPVKADERQEQAAAFFQIWPNHIPNDELYVASFEQDGQDYELVGVKDSYIGRSGYLDAYTVVFAKGESQPLAKIQTDTDREDFICKELAAPVSVD